MLIPTKHDCRRKYGYDNFKKRSEETNRKRNVKSKHPRAAEGRN